MTPVSKAEIIFGLKIMPAGRRRSELENTYENLFTTRFLNRVLPFDDQCTHYMALFAAMSRKRGRGYSHADLEIAAIAASNHATLATRNTEDFDSLGMDLVNPWAD